MFMKTVVNLRKCLTTSKLPKHNFTNSLTGNLIWSEFNINLNAVNGNYIRHCITESNSQASDQRTIHIVSM